jgi:pyruvate dehydrogenase E2 component (dihydrolipoamide acetyltransferase)
MFGEVKMEYKVTMPILSDTMDKGIIVKWHKKEGDKVKKGEVIAEVESDKAIIEVESFYDGYIHLLYKEGDAVEVKKDIAIIYDKPFKETLKEEPKEETQPKQNEVQKQIKETPKKELKKEIKISSNNFSNSSASALAKKIASEFNINLEKLQKENKINIPTHEQDIKEYICNHYFTPKAKKLAKEYDILDKFKFDHKINSDEVRKYILDNNLPKKILLTPNQIGVIKNVENAIKKPTFNIYDEIEITPKNEFKITTLILKVLANTMQKHPKSRTILENDTFLEFQNSNISIAVDREDGLYMVVLKEVEKLSLFEIDKWLKNVKIKRLTITDLKGSTGGISNLGMFGIDRFDALINDKDSFMIAFGAMKENRIKITAKFDHRVFNGVDASKFIMDFKGGFNEI